MKRINHPDFWANAKIGGDEECWSWLGTSHKGYGRFQQGQAHRYAYSDKRGPIPDGMMVRHMCGNKACVNPRHLEPGTAKDNMDDRRFLGEVIPGGWVTLHGEDNPRAKLTAEQAREIAQSPRTGKELAAKFGVSKATVSLIRSGQRWAAPQDGV